MTTLGIVLKLSIDVVGVGTSKNSEELESWEVFGGERRTALHHCLLCW